MTTIKRLFYGILSTEPQMVDALLLADVGRGGALADLRIIAQMGRVSSTYSTTLPDLSVRNSLSHLQQLHVHECLHSLLVLLAGRTQQDEHVLLGDAHLNEIDHPIARRPSGGR
uniref:BPL/LPL catalytic domain-containing protein n=1 Tax=Pristionchus pacificus TaxID=54126 RepID=A0A2A6CER1_PRIPA|eukprot:PDM76606.1 hypothetical protein PRIPAC_42972 [Pristionchus pacificus]